MKSNPKRVLVFLVFLLISCRSYGQVIDQLKADKTKNALFVEWKGSAGYLYNITYERTIWGKDNVQLSLGLGVQYLPKLSDEIDKRVSFTPQINLFIGNEHHFETGIGYIHTIIPYEIGLPFRLGYRYQKQDGGLILKMALMIIKIEPIELSIGRINALPSIGAAVGKTF